MFQMIVKTSNDKQVCLGKLTLKDYENLFSYLSNLSTATKQRFGPHPFDLQSIRDVYKNDDGNIGYVAYDIETGEMIAYTIIKIGYLEHDRFRLQSYGLSLNPKTDCKFAPSVADAWQSCGVGKALFQYILSDLKTSGIKRILLWGGVQAGNDKAVNYYYKAGFKMLGGFDYNGPNYDMLLEIE